MKYFIIIITTILFIGCNSTTTTDKNENKEINTTLNLVEDSNLTIIDRLNSIRDAVGLNSLKTNIVLKNSASNHVKYLIENNETGHNENPKNSKYTGVDPTNRAIYVGYLSRKVLENLSVGQDSNESSFDGLMGAIYHRYGFLAFDIDEIGFTQKDKVYVYNMGNSKLNKLCSQDSFNDSSKYYVGACADSELKIEATAYEEALNSLIDSSEDYVLYPYNNQEDVTPSFYEEIPDPLPNQSVSGIAISIEFNKVRKAKKS